MGSPSNVLDDLPLAVVVAAPDGTEYRNAASLGLASSGDPWWQELLEKVRTTGSAAEDEVERDVGGERRTFHVRAVTRYDGAVLVTFDDVTARRAVERRLREMEERISDIETLARVGTYDYDYATNTYTMSEGLYRIWGLEPGTTVNWELIQEMTHPDDREAMVRGYEESLKAGEETGCEYRNIWSDGSIRWRKGWGRFQWDENGLPVRLHGVNQDITSLKRTEEALRKTLVENEALHAEVRSQLEEVRASRARIVEAADAERRRVERNLHDGAQQRLVTLVLALRVVEAHLAAARTAEAEQTLAKAIDELETALGELRDLAQGIHPAILTEQGLAAAVTSLATRAAVPVVITTMPESRPPLSVETAAYYVICEALANATKHAEPSRVTIGVSFDGSSVVVDVADDGIGGAAMKNGSGLRGLSDRVTALGGDITIVSPPGEGTSVRAVIPCA